MKYLLLLLVALLILWQWRSWRDRSDGQDISTPGSATHPLEMVACLHCGLHFAASEAVTGRLGSYCSVSHRQRHEA